MTASEPNKPRWRPSLQKLASWWRPSDEDDLKSKVQAEQEEMERRLEVLRLVLYVRRFGEPDYHRNA